MDNFLRRTSSKVDEENPYWMSFSDLMSGLLVIFILAAIALIIELTQKSQDIDKSIEELKAAEKARRDIIYDVKKRLAEQGITVEIADNETVIRIPESSLSFESGKDQIPENDDMQRAVRLIGTALHQAILEDGRFKFLDTVFVEGHTDSQGIWYRGKRNWGLSADRAISVWKVWQEELELEPKLGDLLNYNNQRLFSVSGYAATRRVNELEETDEQRAQNRRIDLRLTVKKPTLGQLEQLKKEAE